MNNDPIRQGQVLGPNSPSSRRRATVVLAALGDSRVVGSEIRGEMCRNMESQRDECRLRGDGGGGRGVRACEGNVDVSIRG